MTNVYINDAAGVKSEILQAQPNVVVNAAGKTGGPVVRQGVTVNHIDWCEEHREETLAANVVGLTTLAAVCKEERVPLVHLSSGCIFQGTGPNGGGFREEDVAEPPSFYSWTKWWADQWLMQFWPEGVLIIRLRLPADSVPNPRNLITKLSKYPKIIDVRNSVTVVPDLMEATKALIDQDARGIYHVTNPGSITHLEIMEAFRARVDPKHAYELIPEEDLYKKGIATARRSNCVLNTQKLAQAGILLPDIHERMIWVLKNYAANQPSQTV